MIPLRVAVGFVFLGAAVGLLGATWVDLAPEHRVAIVAAAAVLSLGLLGLDYRGRGTR